MLIKKLNLSVTKKSLINIGINFSPRFERQTGLEPATFGLGSQRSAN